MVSFSKFASALVCAVSVVSAASLQEVTNFGPNPSGAKMFLYVPDNVKPNAPLVVGIHWCSGDAQSYFNASPYAQVADRLGFPVIYPSAVTSDKCWDVASNKSLTHLGGGDSLAIHSMVQYVAQKYSTDRSRIYATGISSGAMMTNVLLGAYPDVFAAGAAFAGVPFGCFAGPTSWSESCAKGWITKTPQQWGDLVRNAFPGYRGKRPKMMLFHGTQDEILSFHNHGEAIKQWTNVLGLSSTPTKVEQNAIRQGWVRQVYGNGQLEAVTETGQTHNLAVPHEEVLRFFGLN